jgi:hypothetical protein
MPCKRVSLYLGESLRNMEGIRFLRLFLRKKRIEYPVPFVDPENINILIVGAIWNCGKRTGLS